MAALTNKEIENELSKESNLIIYPYDENSVTGLGYDLKIGKIKPLTEINKFSEDETKIVIPPHCYCIVITKEFVWLSGNYLGTLHSRGTLSAKGLYTNSTNVDPNFKGQMIMSVINHSSVNIVLQKDEAFITLIFHKTKSKTKMLVGKEGTKNSMRVIDQMLNEIYVPADKYVHERNSIIDLLNYLQIQNTTIGQVFTNKIINSTRPIDSTKLKSLIGKFSNYFKELIENKISFILTLSMLGLIIYFLWDIIKTKDEAASSYENKRLVILFLLAMLGLLDRLIPKKK